MEDGLQLFLLRDPVFFFHFLQPGLVFLDNNDTLQFIKDGLLSYCSEIPVAFFSQYSPELPLRFTILPQMGMVTFWRENPELEFIHCLALATCSARRKFPLSQFNPNLKGHAKGDMILSKSKTIDAFVKFQFSYLLYPQGDFPGTTISG